MKIFRIKKSREFQEISKKSVKYHSKTILIISASTPEFYLLNQKSPTKKITEFCRFGQTVSKKIGNAIIRNKVKRRLRAAMADFSRDLPEYFLNNQDYILIAKKEIANANYGDILLDLKFCLKGIIRLSKASR